MTHIYNMYTMQLQQMEENELPTFQYYMQMLVQNLSYFVVGAAVNEPWVY